MAQRRRRDSAERQEISAFAHELDDNYLMCRNLGHSWRPLRAKYQQKERAYFVAYLCQRCTAERHQWLDTRGLIVSGSYSYPEGYEHKRQGRITADGRGALRLEQLNRVLSQTEVSEGES